MRASAGLLLLAACNSTTGSTTPIDEPRVDPKITCDQLLARTAADYAVFKDPEPAIRRKAIVSDLHLGPGNTDPVFAGIEDFTASAQWTAFLASQPARTDLIIDGDFIEFWQIAAALGVLPSRDDPKQPQTGAILAADEDFGVKAANIVIAAHPTVFRDLQTFLDTGDRRVIIIPGNHDADLHWPRVQRAIVRAIAPKDPKRLILVDAAAYEHAGVHVEHGHALDPANRFETDHAPFGRDRDGACRLQSNWGEIFVDRFYTETEKQVPFIDNLYPESAAILWTVRDNSDPARDISAALRFLDLVRVAESRAFNKAAAKTVLENVLGGRTEEKGDVLDRLLDRMVDNDPTAQAVANAALSLITDPELATIWSGVIAAGRALPDFGAALDALKTIDPSALAKLRMLLLGEPLESAARALLAARPDLSVIVYGHTHTIGGELHRLDLRGRTGFYVNTGSWLPVASVADLRREHIDFSTLSIADATHFPSKTTAIIIDYDANSQPIQPAIYPK